MDAKRGLIIVFRDENASDFEKISRRLLKIDSRIRILGFGNRIDLNKIPKGFFELPHLIIYLVNPPPVDYIHQSPKLNVRFLGKLEEYELFKKHGLSALPIEPFKWGANVDKRIYGDWVVLKPEFLTSTGADVNMIPTDELQKIKPEDFPENHLIHSDSYLVQRLLITGDRPSIYRATLFLGKVLYSLEASLNSPYPKKDSEISELLRTSIATNQHSNRTFRLLIDERKNLFCMRVAEALSEFPLLAIDVLEHPETKELFVLEINAGGNTWHFSSERAKNTQGYNEVIKKEMVLQYKAWDTAALALSEALDKYAK